MIYRTSCIWEKRSLKRNAEKESGRRLLKYALFSEFGICGEPEIALGEHGKPYLLRYPQIQFNISHTEESVLLMLGAGAAGIGIDAETIKPVHRSLLKGALSEEERAFYESLDSESAKQEWFFKVWTLKESFLKALGIGITVPLSSISFSEGADGEVECRQSLSGETWHFSQIRRRRTMISVCSQREETKDWLGRCTDCFF